MHVIFAHDYPFASTWCPNQKKSVLASQDAQEGVSESVTHGAVPRNPCAAPRNPMAPRVEVPCGAASRGPWGQNENPKMLSFGRL